MCCQTAGLFSLCAREMCIRDRAEVAEEARAAKEAAAGEAPGCEACGEGYSCGDCSSCSGCADGERLAGPSAPLPAEPAFYGAQKGEEGGEAADDE